MSLASFGAIFTAAALRQTSVAITFVLTDIKRYAMQIANSRYRFTISWHWMLIYPKYWTATRDVMGLYPLSIRVQTQGWPHGKLGARCWKYCYIISYLASGKLINQDKNSSWWLQMLKLEEIFALVAILCHRYKMLTVWKISIARLFCFEL